MGKDLKGRKLPTGITQKKDGRYSARFTDRFGERPEYCSTDLYEVKKWLKESKSEDTLKQNVRDESTTLNSWYDTWFSSYKGSLNVRANTRRQYEQIYTTHIKPILGGVKLVNLKQTDVANLIQKLKDDGFRYETQHKVYVMLIDMLDRAIVDDLLSKNVARHATKLTKDAKEPRALTIEEQKCFFECAKGTFYYNLFLVHILTGLRPGEICALTEKDIDFENLKISINKTLFYQKLEELGDTKKEFHIGPPKTKSSIRNVDIDEKCADALKKQLKQKAVIKDRLNAKPCKGFENLIFTTKYNTPINSQIYCDAIKHIVDELNLPLDTLEQIDPFNPHTFRHSFATRCFEAGIATKTVQKALGHKTLSMTVDLYMHLLDKHKEEELKKFSGYMDKLFKDEDEDEDADISKEYDDNF